MSELNEIRWLLFIAKTDKYCPTGEVLFIKPYYSEGGGGFGKGFGSSLSEDDAYAYETSATTAYEAMRKAGNDFRYRELHGDPDEDEDI